MTHSMRAALVLAALLLAGCLPSPSPSLTESATIEPTPSPTVEPTPTVAPTASAEPTPTPAPSLSLTPPESRDERVVTVDVAPNVPAGEDGMIVVTVTSAADTRVDELVLRWPTALGETLLLAPFVPSEDRIREGGPPLVQPWTKWVVGPGERGEPAGTTSLGWGPLLAGATLEIPIVVTRTADGPVAFDLQLLAGESLLTLDDGNPAQVRVDVP
jgi:hypothetical protein